MKRTYLIIFAVLMAGLLGCGSNGPGSPGSTGTEDINAIVSAALVPTHLDGEETTDVDVLQNPDCDGDPETIDPEPFTDHSVNVTVTGSTLTPELPVGKLFLERYTVEFFKDPSFVGLGAPPIESFEGFVSAELDLPSGSPATVTFTAEFIDLNRKFKYLGDVTSGDYEVSLADYPIYTAKYTFYGKDQYGEQFSLIAQVTVSLGSYDNCDQ